MRTLATQVKLRRLIRTFAESADRLGSDPMQRRMAGSIVDRLLGLAGEVRETWLRESLARPQPPALDGYVKESLRTAERAIVGLQQPGADLQLLLSHVQALARPPHLF